MSELSFVTDVQRGWKSILSLGALIATIAVIVSFAFPQPSGGRLEYSSTMRLLVIQRSLGDVDSYTAFKSTERISDSLSQIVYTTDFYDKVMAAGLPIDTSVFEVREDKKRRQWSKMISTTVLRGSGLLQVTVYHKDKAQATAIAQAIAKVLASEGKTYVGSTDLGVTLVDAPLESRFPVRPNVPANMVGGFMLGVMGGVVYVLIGGKKRGQGLFA
jgi:capsular polysaccharide biosynthesis protein